MGETLKIEIGGGTLCEPGWVNLDPVHGEAEWKRKAQETPWPVADNSVSRLHASHVMEHIPAGQERIDVMNEAWRVLEPGGEFTIKVPFILGVLPLADGQHTMTVCWPAIADPTHVSYWCAESFHYFDGRMAACADYGIRLWKTNSLVTVDGWEGNWKGTPVK